MVRENACGQLPDKEGAAPLLNEMILPARNPHDSGTNLAISFDSLKDFDKQRFSKRNHCHAKKNAAHENQYLYLSPEGTRNCRRTARSGELRCPLEVRPPQKQKTHLLLWASTTAYTKSFSIDKTICNRRG